MIFEEDWHFINAVSRKSTFYQCSIDKISIFFWRSIEYLVDIKSNGSKNQSISNWLVNPGRFYNYKMYFYNIPILSLSRANNFMILILIFYTGYTDTINICITITFITIIFSLMIFINNIFINSFYYIAFSWIAFLLHKYIVLSLIAIYCFYSDSKC